MSRAIKVEDKVYQDLDAIRTKGQTFSQVIEDVLKSRRKIFDLLSVLEGQMDYREWQRKRLEELQLAGRG